MALRLLLRVSLSMPEREAQGKYVPCENEAVQALLKGNKAAADAFGKGMRMSKYLASCF